MVFEQFSTRDVAIITEPLNLAENITSASLVQTHSYEVPLTLDKNSDKEHLICRFVVFIYIFAIVYLNGKRNRY